MEYWNASHFQEGQGSRPSAAYGYEYSTAIHLRAMGDLGEAFVPACGKVLTRADNSFAVASSEWNSQTVEVRMIGSTSKLSTVQPLIRTVYAWT